MAQVKLPNGEIVEVPDNMPPDEIRRNILRAFPEQFPDAPKSKAADMAIGSAMPDNADVMALARTNRAPLPPGGGMTPAFDPTRENKIGSWLAGKYSYEPVKDASGNVIPEIEQGIPGNTTLQDIQVAARMVFSTDPVKRAAMIVKMYPGAKVREQGGQTIIKFPDGTERTINKKGLSWQDVIDTFRELAFMGGLAKLIGAGGRLVTQAGRAGVAVGGTEAVLGAGAKLAGSGDDWFDVASRAGASGLMAGGGTLAVGGLTNVIGNMFAKRPAGAADDFAKLGIKPLFSERYPKASKYLGLKEFENQTVNLPGGASAAANRYTKNALKFESAIKKSIADLNVKDTSKVAAGRTIEKGVGGYKDRALTQHDLMVKKLNVDPETRVNLQGTFNVLKEDDLGAFEAAAKAAKSNFLASLSDDLERLGKNATWKEVNALRRKIGEMRGEVGLLPDTSKRQLSKIYGALSDDLRGALSPEKAAKWDTINKFMRTRIQRLEEAEFVLAKGGKVDEIEKVYAAVRSGAKLGETLATKVMNKLTPAERDVVRARFMRDFLEDSVTAKMPEGAPLSPSKLLSQWKAMDPAAIKAIFRGDKKTYENLQRIFRVADRLERSSALGANTSNTGRAITGPGSFIGGVALTAATGNPAYLFAPVGLYTVGRGGLKASQLAASTTSTLLKSARFVNWLSESTKLKGAAAISRHVGKLGLLAERVNPDTRDAIEQYLEALRGR